MGNTKTKTIEKQTDSSMSDVPSSKDFVLWDGECEDWAIKTYGEDIGHKVNASVAMHVKGWQTAIEGLQHDQQKGQ